MPQRCIRRGRWCLRTLGQLIQYWRARCCKPSHRYSSYDSADDAFHHVDEFFRDDRNGDDVIIPAAVGGVIVSPRFRWPASARWRPAVSRSETDS